MYIYLVDSGRLLHLNVTPAHSVDHFKEVIEDFTSRLPLGPDNTSWAIPKSRQILLDANGTALSSSEPLMSYSTGTEDNPVFLFNADAIKNPSIVTYLNLCAPPQIQTLTASPDAAATLELHSRLAADYDLSASDHEKCFNGLTREIYLQIQGCDAAMSNLLYHARKTEAQHDDFKRYHEQVASAAPPVLAATEPIIAALLAIPVHPNVCPPSLPLGPLAECLQATGTISVDELRKAATDAARVLAQLAAAGTEFTAAIAALNQSIQQERSPLMLDLSNVTKTITGVLQEQRAATEIIRTQCMRARESLGAERSILQQYAEHHLQLAHGLHERDIRLRELCRTLADIKQEFTRDVKTKLQAVMAGQQRMKQVKQEHSVKTYVEAGRRVETVVRSLTNAARVPQAYLCALGEMVRRKPFSKKYTEIAKSSSERLTVARQNEIDLRKQFDARHKQLLPSWPAFEALNDYPHSCVTTFRPFDDQLPEITAEDFKTAEQIVKSNLSDPRIADLLLPWDSIIVPLSTMSSLESTSSTDQERIKSLQEQLLALHCECEQLQTEVDTLREANTSQQSKAEEELLDRAKQAELAAQRLEDKNRTLQQTASRNERLLSERDAELMDLRQRVQSLQEQQEKKTTSSFLPADVSASPAAAISLDSSIEVSEAAAVSGALLSARGPRPALSFTDFQEGDLALFVPWKKEGKRVGLVAFNRGAPFRILSPKSLENLGIDRQSSKSLVVVIEEIHEKVATEDKEYNFEPGHVYYEIDGRKYDLQLQASVVMDDPSQSLSLSA